MSPRLLSTASAVSSCAELIQNTILVLPPANILEKIPGFSHLRKYETRAFINAFSSIVFTSGSVTEQKSISLFTFTLLYSFSKTDAFFRYFLFYEYHNSSDTSAATNFQKTVLFLLKERSEERRVGKECKKPLLILIISLSFFKDNSLSLYRFHNRNRTIFMHSAFPKIFCIYLFEIRKKTSEGCSMRRY